MIYNMYLNGMGMRKIQFELEAAGRKTSTGLTRWYSSYISRVLNNPFYVGKLCFGLNSFFSQYQHHSSP